MLGQRVERHLPVAAIVDESGSSQRAQMMRNQVLRTFHDPGEIADAELAAVAECQRDRQSSRVGERTESLRQRAGLDFPETLLPKLFRMGEVDAEQFTAIIIHEIILTHVDALVPTRRGARLERSDESSPLAYSPAGNW